MVSARAAAIFALSLRPNRWLRSMSGLCKLPLSQLFFVASGPLARKADIVLSKAREKKQILHQQEG